MAKKIKPLTKSEFTRELAAKLGITSSAAGGMLDSLDELVTSELKKTGKVTIPGIVRLTVKSTPAKPARMGTLPGTNKQVQFKAKPAGKKVTARAVSAIKNKV